MWVFDGNKHFRATYQQWAWGPMAPPHRPMVERATLSGVRLRPFADSLEDNPVLAEVRWNTWIACCPDCRGAEFVWLDNLLFMCNSCWNGAIGGMWRRVILPPNVAEIEAALMRRPAPENRNWLPHETVEELLAQNAEHGL